MAIITMITNAFIRGAVKTDTGKNINSIPVNWNLSVQFQEILFALTEKVAAVSLSRQAGLWLYEHWCLALMYLQGKHQNLQQIQCYIFKKVYSSNTTSGRSFADACSHTSIKDLK